MAGAESQQLAGQGDAINCKAGLTKGNDCLFKDAYNLTPKSSAEAKIVRHDNCAPAISQDLPAGLPVCEWESTSSNSKGIVVALHGSAGDTLSFDGIARHFAADGFTVFAMGERGHDRWVSGPKTTEHDRLFNYKQSSDDLGALLVALKKKSHDKPIFLLGESIGSQVAATAAGKHPELVSGMILSSPGNKPQHYDLGYVIPDLINHIRHPNRQLDVSRYITRYASDNPEIASEMLADPLARKTMSTKDVLNTISFEKSATSTYKHLNANIPVLIVQGAQDHVVTPESAKQIFVELKSTDKQMVTLPDSGHIILQTTKMMPMAENAVTDWLNNHADASQVTQVGYASEK